MSNYVPPEYTLEELLDFNLRIGDISNRLLSMLEPSIEPKTIYGHQFYHYGVLRRLLIIRESYESLIILFPPNRNTHLNSDETNEAILHLNSIYLHIWGCIDNLAWVIAYETNFLPNQTAPNKVKKSKVCLFNKRSFDCALVKWFPKLFSCTKSKNLCEHISSISSKFYEDANRYMPWIKKLEKRRHPAAHRIPLYMVPYFLTTKRQVSEWEARAEESLQQVREGMENGNEEMLREAGSKMDDLGHSGVFSPNITHELKFNKEGKVQKESFDPLYPTILDDCEQLLNLVEQCTIFLSTRE